jgi:LacI family transcriptional regulator
VAAAVERALCDRGLDIHVLALSPDGHLPPDIRQGKVDGIIGRMGGPIFQEAARRLPAVNLDVYDPEADAYSLMPDYAAGGQEIARRLLAAGHRRLALLTHAPQDETPMFWNAFARGCLRAFAQAGLPPNPDLFQGTAGLPSQGHAIGCRLFRDPASRPDAVVGPDGALLGVYRAAGECGVRIPEHVSLVGINNLPLDEYLWPPLASLDVGLPELAARAVSLLQDAIESGARRKGLELSPVSLRVRPSARL